MERKKYENKELGVSFTLPVEMTVREQLAYRSRSATIDLDDFLSQSWLAALPLLDDWKCKFIPDPAKLDLDKETSKAIANAVGWTSNTVIVHMNELDEVPPNS